MPRISGAYFSETEEHVGAGGTRKSVLTRVHWFVVILDDGRHVVQPLNAENMPGGFKRIVAREDFLADYAPDPGHYNQFIRPVLESLRAKIGRNEGYVDLNQFTDHERLVFKALQMDEKLAKNGETAAAGKHRVVREMLECIPVMEEGLFAFQCAVNEKSIELRKSGDYERAIHFYLKALRLKPHDDHIYFNLARAYWHNGQSDKAAEHLNRALELNPGFTEARRFVAYLERAKRKPRKTARIEIDMEAELPAFIPNVDVDLDIEDFAGESCEWNVDHRLDPRVVPRAETSCAMLVANREYAARVCDISDLGAKLECGEELPLSPGLRVVLMERPGLLSGTLGMRKADVVWLEGKTIGVCFVTPLDISTEELRERLTR